MLPAIHPQPGEPLMEAPENQPESPTTSPAEPAEPQLKAGRVFALFALFLVIQGVTGFLIGLGNAVIASLQGANLQDPQVLAQVSQQAVIIATFLGFLLAGTIVLYLSTHWFPKKIYDRGMTGAAWKIGPPQSQVLGFGVGLLIAISYLVLAPLMSTPPAEDSMGPFSKMATTPGLQQVVALVIGLLLAPPVEELLFRGVMFGGFCRSFGPVWAATLTTVLFVACHIIEAMHYWPALLFIGLMALAALWLRLFTRTIGPAIALHFGYNLAIFSTVFLAT
jgi:membrane protease YdiL (CAAX protease family)